MMSASTKKGGNARRHDMLFHTDYFVLKAVLTILHDRQQILHNFDIPTTHQRKPKQYANIAGTKL